ncbi:AAA family ATPase [Candidatus Aerophobetes bacterium]|nr:AAA family ATPase [Candidatus Aerophobetes bacterium]
MEINNEKIKRFQRDIERIRKELAKVIVGQKQIIEGIIIAILSNGHVLLEGVPGLGKTLLIKSLSQTMDLKFSRIQFTPDLMPADILGTNILMQGEDGRRFFKFQEGPIFAQIILADEINRATPKTQSALLEAMQEQKVTVAGVTRPLGRPFFVLATQNPLEMEGVYPLPEAQIDRFFFKLKIDYPDYEELQQIVGQTTVGELPLLEKIIDGEELCQIQSLVRKVLIASHVLKYATRLTMGTHPDSKFATPQIRRFVRYGASPRGAQTLVLAGKALAFMENRFNVSFSDIREVALPSLRHRILLNFEGEAEGVDIDKMIEDLIKVTPEREDG